MESIVLIYRLVTIAIVVVNVLQVLRAIRKPPDWRYPDPKRYPLTLSRNVWIVGGMLGAVAGLAVLAYSFVLFPN